MRVLLRGFYTEQACCSAYVAETLKIRKVELSSEGFEVDPREASHRPHELFESRQFLVEFLEHSLLAMLGFILRPSRAQGLGQVVPELKEARVEHDQDAADIARAVAIQIE